MASSNTSPFIPDHVEELYGNSDMARLYGRGNPVSSQKETSAVQYLRKRGIIAEPDYYFNNTPLWIPEKAIARRNKQLSTQPLSTSPPRPTAPKVADNG